MNELEPIFALDIGTRVVMGLLMVKNESGFEILAGARTEHRQRAMYDGQVHDVDEVAKAVREVKEELEAKVQFSLHSVAVAAAGRALRTETAVAEHQETVPVRWEKENVLALEMEAVQQALRQIEINSGDDWVTHHCVGYNVVQRWLEGQEIASLIGQRGRRAKVEVIATFLPRTVIDGLVAVLHRVGLQMKSLNLEPIAAGQAAIPANMRRMNLALVDIGAGTADIALTRDGAFFAYGMVPMAGDEVTEAICTHYLLDFHIGEKIKREIAAKAKLTFADFFGTKFSVSKDEVLEVINPVVRKLTEKITEQILALNGGVPQAVILIGGGSLTPLLPDMLADTIGIPRARVGIQVRERIPGVIGEKTVKGSEGVTPIGIGIAALEEQGLHYYSVAVNDIPVPIFELQLATVAEALLAAGIQPRSFLGRPGKALTFELNGEVCIVKGSLGKPAQLLVNGQPARLEQTLVAGDNVRFTPGIPGEDAAACMQDVVALEKGKRVFWNGQLTEYPDQILLNGVLAGPEDRVPDGGKLVHDRNDDLVNFLSLMGYQLGDTRQINLRVNGHRRTLASQPEILLNGTVARENGPLRDGDRVDLLEKPIFVRDLGLEAQPLIFTVNGEELVYPPLELKVWWHGREVTLNEQVVDGMDLRVEGFSRMPILSEILPYVKLPDSVAPGSKLTLSVNGQQAEFTTVLHPGDRITVAWTAQAV